MILLQNIQEFKQQITVKGEVSNVVPEFNESEPDNYEYGDEFSSYYDGGDSDVETWILTLGFGPAVWTRGLSADCHPLSADRISGIFFGYPPFTVTYPIIPGYPWIPTIIHGYPSDIRLNLVSSNF